MTVTICKKIKGFLISLLLVAILGSFLGEKLQISEGPLMTPSAYAQGTNLGALMERAVTEGSGTSGSEDELDRLLSGEEEPKKPINIDKLVEKVATLSTYVNKIFNPFIHFITFQIGGLLNNDYIFAGNMGTMLQTIWRVNRNIVNIVFVLILLYLALKHIFAPPEGGTDLRKVLPMFAIMLIAVNFSWLASKVVLDAANVITNVVFSVPTAVKGVLGEELHREIFKKEGCTITEDNKVKGLCVPTQIYYPVNTDTTLHMTEEQCNDATGGRSVKEKYRLSFPADHIDEEGETVAAESTLEETDNDYMGGIATFCWQVMDLSNYNQNNASYYLSYSMARIQNLAQAEPGEKIASVAIGTIFAIIIQLIYMVSFTVLFIAMIIRIAALWFLVSFSPFLVLLAFMKKNTPEFGGAEAGPLSLGTFTHFAFAPTKVAAVWSIGFIMIVTGQSMGFNFFGKTNESGAINGKLVQVSSLFMGMETLQQFMWLLMTTGIIWVGTFAVLNDMKIVKAITTKIDSAGKGLARRVAESPTWAPIMPLYDHETGTWRRGSLAKAIPNINEWMDKKQRFYQGGEKGTADFARGKENLANLNSSQQGELDRIVAEVDTRKKEDLAVKFITTHAGVTSQMIHDNHDAFKAMIDNSDPAIKTKIGNFAVLAMEGAKRAKGKTEKPTPAAPAAPAAAPAAGAPPGAAPPAAVR